MNSGSLRLGVFGVLCAALPVLPLAGTDALAEEPAAPPSPAAEPAPSSMLDLIKGPLVIGAGVRSTEDTSAAALTADFEDKRTLKMWGESIEWTHMVGYGIEAHAFHTLYEWGVAEFYRRFDLDAYFKYYLTHEMPKGQFITSLAVRGRVDAVTEADKTLAFWTAKPEIWVEMPFTDQKTSRLGPLTLFIGYAFADAYQNDAGVTDPNMDDRWEIEVEWPFLRGMWGGGFEASYAGEFAVYDDLDPFAYHALTITKFIGRDKAVSLTFAGGERKPDFVRDFKVSAGYRTAF